MHNLLYSLQSIDLASKFNIFNSQNWIKDRLLTVLHYIVHTQTIYNMHTTIHTYIRHEYIDDTYVSTKYTKHILYILIY